MAERTKFRSKNRIAVAGQSFGGIKTVLGAEKYSYCAVIDASGAAMSWDEAPALQEMLKMSAKNSKSPMFLFQAENDFTLAPSKELYKEMNAVGKIAEIKIYPPYGKTHFDGHSLTWLGSSIWFEDVFAFLEKHCVK